MYRIGEEEKAAVARVIDSKCLFKTGSPLQECMHCEEEMKEKFGCEYVTLMSSGKGALISALVGAGVGPGDQVIVPGYTYIATAIAVTAVGAIPVICEVDETLTIDVKDAESKITPHTKAIIPVHIQGFPCDMDGVMALAKKYHLAVIEDACQADGGKYHGRALGTIGDAGALSFNYFKIITAGEGGALLTNDRNIFMRGLIHHDSSAICFFGNQMDGITEEPFCGSEFRVGEITGAILREQLKKLDGILADLKRVHDGLKAALADTFRFAPSNDADGDCNTVLAVQFDTVEEALAFESKAQFGRPINTGKHVYCNWTALMNKRGAFNPAFDPFKMEANKDIIPEYTTDMCPKTLDILSRTCYIGINPEMSDADVAAYAKQIKASMA